VFSLLGKDPVLISPDRIPERLLFLTEGIKMTDSAEGRQLVAIDTASPSQLGSTYEKGVPILSIDHHRVNTPYSDNFTLPDAYSAAEVLFGIVKELEKSGRITVTRSLAERIYAAIASDTGGFIYSNASKQTYLAAAGLLEYGIDHADINRRLFNSKSKEQLRAEGYVALNLKSAADGRISYAVLSKEERDALGLAFPDFETAIDVARSVMGADIAFVLKETDDGKFKASIRSCGIDVASVAKRHSGGGHTRAAGCTVDADTLSSAEEILKADLTAALAE
jgi:phosphoesterase RecJ-like protein